MVLVSLNTLLFIATITGGVGLLITVAVYLVQQLLLPIVLGQILRPFRNAVLREGDARHEVDDLVGTRVIQFDGVGTAGFGWSIPDLLGQFQVDWHDVRKGVSSASTFYFSKVSGVAGNRGRVQWLWLNIILFFPFLVVRASGGQRDGRICLAIKGQLLVASIWGIGVCVIVVTVFAGRWVEIGCELCWEGTLGRLKRVWLELQEGSY